MEKEMFLNYVKNMILPMFTGSSILGEVESNPRDSEVALGHGGTVLIKPSKNDEYRLVLKRNIAFKASEVALLKAIIAEIAGISNLNFEEESYVSRLNLTAIEKAICQSISEVACNTLLNILMYLENFANRTYEGQRITFGIIINEKQESLNPVKNIHYQTMFNNDFFAVLSNGAQSCVEFDKNGYYLGHMTLEKIRFRPTISPYDYISFCRYCDDARIGIVLTANGEILLFKGRSLIFSKKRGIWSSYCHEEIITLLSNRTSQSIKEIRKSIYLTALDVAFSGCGGCLVYLNRDYREQALTHIDFDDILCQKHYEIKQQQTLEQPKKKSKQNTVDYSKIPYEEYVVNYEKAKTSSLKTTIAGRKFHELDRKLREELASIDGATIVDYDGTIVACGAIIRIEAGSTGGGRLAATKTLARYGVAVKISQDGTMQAYMLDKKNKGVKEIFSVG